MSLNITILIYFNNIYRIININKIIYELIMEYIYKIKDNININFKNYKNLNYKYLNVKILIFLFIFIGIKIYLFIIKEKNYLLNYNYLQIQNEYNIIFNKKIKNKINIGIYAFSIKNGGRARVTSLLINYFNNIKIFNLYLFIRKLKEEDEYKIPDNIKRILIKDDLVNKIKKNKINILIYQLSLHDEIKKLNDLNSIKVIFYQHLGIFDWIYGNYSIFKSIYRDYIYSKYVVNIIPYENDYLFKKWGIKSIFMNNFITYNYNNIIKSNLSSKTILMIGRGDAKKKRFEIGLYAMEYINQEIPQSQMLIISDLTGVIRHEFLINNLNIKNNIKFLGYTASPEIYYKNTSLNLFPSISEAFPLVMCETKIYGIPNILLGLDYTSISEGGTVIIYDETPESFAKVAIYVLKKEKYRYKLGRNARNSMKQFNNDLLLIKWIKLILSIYNGEIYFDHLRIQDKNLSQEKISKIMNKQIKLLKKRIPIFHNITINDIENFSHMEKYNII